MNAGPLRSGREAADLYPLTFEPIFEYRPWGGRHLADLLSTSLPGDAPVGEAWVLSDRDDHMSVVADGPLRGRSIRELLEDHPEEMLGPLAGSFQRFPLLLKFLDARENLSVQVHPSDRQVSYLPEGESGKTEGWVVLRAEAEGRVYAGLTTGTTMDELRSAVRDGTVAEHLVRVAPKAGDAFFIPAGAVHSLGGNVVVFEVQQNSDVTFRLFDWNRTDPETGEPRSLQVEEGLACTDLSLGPTGPVVPYQLESNALLTRERLFGCDRFEVRRLRGGSAFPVGEPGRPRIVVGIDGDAELDCGVEPVPVTGGTVVLLPAAIGTAMVRPSATATVLEITIPEPTPP